MQPKRRNRKRAVTVGKWVDAAISAKKLLVTPVPRGQVQSRLKEVAASVGLTHNTLSNYLLSHDFVTEVEKNRPDVAYILFRAAPIAVDAYRRWATHDAEGAFRHVLEYGRGGIRIVDVIEAEKSARQRTYPDKTSDSFDRLMRSREAHHVLIPTDSKAEKTPLALMTRSSFNPVGGLAHYDSAFAKWVGLSHIGVGPDLNLDAMCEQQAWRGKADLPNTGAGIVGVIEVKPVSIKESYRAIARQIALQATVASRFFDLVVVLLTDEEAMMEITSFLQEQALPPAPQGKEPDTQRMHGDGERAKLLKRSFLALPGAEGSVMFTYPEICLPLLLHGAA